MSFSTNTWTEFKLLVTTFSLSIQFVENENDYFLVARKNDILFENVVKKTTPKNADQIDFETNFKSDGNKHDTIFGILGLTGDRLKTTNLKELPNSIVTSLSTVNSTESNIAPIAGQQRVIITNIGGGKIFYSYTTGVDITYNFISKGEQVQALGENLIFLVKSGAGTIAIQIDREVRT